VNLIRYSSPSLIVDLFFISLFLNKWVPGADKLGLAVFAMFGAISVINSKKITYFEVIFLIYVLFLIVSSLIHFYNYGFLEPALYSIIWGFIFLNLRFLIDKCNNNNLLFEKLRNKFVNYMLFIVAVGIIDFIVYLKFGYVSFLRTYDIDWSVESFFGNPNPFGMASAIAVCFVLSKERVSFKFLKSVFLIIGIIISGSKMALASLVLFLLIIKLDRKKLTFIIISLLTIMIYLFKKYQDLVILVLNKRYEIWNEGFTFVSQSDYGDFIGLGSGTFQKYYSSDPNMGLHSYYIHLLVETGFIGFFIFLTMIIYLFIKFGNSKELSILFLILASGLTENFILNEQIIQLAFVLTISAVLVKKRNAFNGLCKTPGFVIYKNKTLAHLNK